MTIEERLNVTSIDKSEEKKPSIKPSADSLATLLAQGLQSSDRAIINVRFFNKSCLVYGLSSRFCLLGFGDAAALHYL